METVSRWERKLSIKCSDVVFATEEMVSMLCQAIKQSHSGAVAHDCTLALDFQCRHSGLGDDSFSKILAEAFPAIMRKSGRVVLANLDARGNKLTDVVLSEFVEIVNLHKSARYRYKVSSPIGGTINLSDNSIVNPQTLITTCLGLSQVSVLDLSRNTIPTTIVTICQKYMHSMQKLDLGHQKVAISAAEMTSALREKMGLGKSPDGQKSATTPGQSLLSLLQKGTGGSPVPPSGRGMSLSDLETQLLTRAAVVDDVGGATATAVGTTTVHAALRVFSPFEGAVPLCGLELQVDDGGYRVVRVTEKPGQNNSVREGDLITHIGGESLGDRGTIRTVFGRNLREGVSVTIVRGGSLPAKPSGPVWRELNFGLMLAGAGLEWRPSSFPQTAQQAKLVCEAGNVEGELDLAEAPILQLKGDVAQVDKVMRQFCVVIVKSALANRRA